MPFKSEKINLAETQDRRRKLTELQKLAIKEEYAKGDISQRLLAKKYNVSKSSIQVIVNYKRAEYVQQRIKEHWRDYSDRKKLTEATKNLRRYKQGLYLKGELLEKQKKRELKDYDD